MEIWRTLDSVPPSWPSSAIAIGVFDGVHRGHQALIKQMLASASPERESSEDIKTVVITFDPHPAAVVAPGREPLALSSVNKRIELLAALGIDAVWVLPFNKELSQLSPEEFVQKLLVDTLHAAHVTVGENFRFGFKAAGTTDTLRTLGQDLGFDVTIAALSGDEENQGRAGENLSGAWSSTRVRKALIDGNVELAADILGRPFAVEGTVEHGQARGAELGFPTANIAHDANLAIPADGVYAGWLHHGAKDGSKEAGTPTTDALETTHAAAISIGTNPTFHGTMRTVEAYALDFSGNLYEQKVRLDITHRLRGQIAFEGIEPLIAQIETDVADTRRVLELDK